MSGRCESDSGICVNEFRYPIDAGGGGGAATLGGAGAFMYVVLDDPYPLGPPAFFDVDDGP